MTAVFNSSILKVFNNTKEKFHITVAISHEISLYELKGAHHSLPRHSPHPPPQELRSNCPSVRELRRTLPWAHLPDDMFYVLTCVKCLSQ